ncbi:MAG: hypothetical protein ACR2N7_00765 [Acidimicrobiia bacterium]
MPSQSGSIQRVHAIRAIHTAIWVIVEAAVGYLIFAGVTRRSNRVVTASAALVVGETIIFTVNGFRCPLTDLAESACAESGSVTDIYLPVWLARSLPVIHVPLAIVILYLHRNRFNTKI